MEPNWNAFKKATGTELELIRIKKRLEELEKKLELLLNEQKRQKETSS